ncbi:cobalt transporter (plasmid) [Acaryochloris sp. 'Moss Beach']|uniref:cobalt transporter n=1 Tax=Acaryochloris sp. 'Moss Beach' TaxID=2740837 RepID=UPI001F217398|nr:cobalt transporter [Acaryochloris sp. 'Moss Beach']UJB72859.1 cobalt transporter [Acaryochloris sp. 'Moss Beach']
MKQLPLLSSILALSLAMSTPAAMAHVGHGDEFQAEGGVNRVEVNTQTDSLLGIKVTSIEPAADASGTVMIPVTALVEDNGRQLVFVQYENFYEPVPVTTGATKGEMVEVLEGLSVDEQLVTEGSLSLYAESRKTQATEAAPATNEAHAQADEKGDMVKGDPSEAATAEKSGGMPKTLLAAVGGGIGLSVVAIVLISNGRKKKNTLS